MAQQRAGKITVSARPLECGCLRGWPRVKRPQGQLQPITQYVLTSGWYELLFSFLDVQDLHAAVTRDVRETSAILKWQSHTHKKKAIKKVKNRTGFLMSQKSVGLNRSLQGTEKTRTKTYTLEARNYLYNKTDCMKSCSFLTRSNNPSPPHKSRRSASHRSKNIKK